MEEECKRLEAENEAMRKTQAKVDMLYNKYYSKIVSEQKEYDDREKDATEKAKESRFPWFNKVSKAHTKVFKTDKN